MAKRKTATPIDGLPPRPAPDDTSPEAFKALMKRCNTPLALPEDVEALRALAPHYPRLAEIGNMVFKALDRLQRDFYKGSDPAFMRVGAEAYIAQRRRELGYDTCPALERPLIDALVLCEQRLGYAELFYSTTTEASTGVLRIVETRLDGAHRRYLRLVETLARIRRVRIEAYASDGERVAGVAVERPGA